MGNDISTSYLEYHAQLSNGKISWQDVLTLITQNPQEVTPWTLQDILKVGTNDGENFEDIDCSNPIPLSLIQALLKVPHVLVYDMNIVINLAFRNPAITIDVFNVILLHSMSPVNPDPLDYKHFAHLTSSWNVAKTRILLHSFPNAQVCILKDAILHDYTESIINEAMIDADFFGVTKALRDILLSKVEEPYSLPIFTKVVHLNQETVQKMIHLDILVKRDVWKFELLHAAILDKNKYRYRIAADRVKMLKLLINLNPQAMWIQNKTGYSALHCAIVQCPHHEILQLLIEEGVKFNIGGKNGLGGLLIPDQTNSKSLPLLDLFKDKVETYDLCKMLCFLFKSDGPIVLPRNDIIKEYKLLYHLIENRLKFTSELMIIGNAFPDLLQARTHEGNLPIHFAVKKKILDLEGIKLLLNGDTDGRSLMIENDNGHTALELFFLNVIKETKDFWECLELFWEKSRGLPLLQCAYNARMEEGLLKKIIIRFDDCIHNLDSKGCTLLHCAVLNQKQGRFPSLEFIINTNPTAGSIPDTDGRLPLYLALESTPYFNWTRRIKAVAESYYVNGVDCKSGLYPFMYAASRRGRDQDLDSIYHLLRQSPHHLDHHGVFSLHKKGMTDKKRVRTLTVDWDDRFKRIYHKRSNPKLKW